MKAQPASTNSDLLSRLRAVIDPSADAWLVGGAVRDQLAGRLSHDLDFIVPQESGQIARLTADALNGNFYPLDAERGMYRVLVSGENQTEVIDFSRLQAETLEADLAMRDFTINAMAVKLHDPAIWMDPLNGRQDIKDKILRPCSDLAYQNDPVRTIRAARMSLEFDLRMFPGGLSLIQDAAQRLDSVSAERKRDEFLKLLDGKHPASAIRLLDSFGVLHRIIPELDALKGVSQSTPHSMDVWEHTLATVAQLDQLLDLFLSPVELLKDGGNLTLGLAAGKLGEFRPAVRAHYQNVLNPFRSRRSLNLFSALLHDIGKPAARSCGVDGRVHFYRHELFGAEMAAGVGQRLALSDVEIRALTTQISHHMQPRLISAENPLPTRRSIFHFYRSTGDPGVDTCFLSLADFLALSEHVPDQDAWTAELERVAVYLEGWFKQRDVWIEPARLLTGDEIMDIFHLPPGRMIGEVLDQIQESLAAGEISSRDEALELAKVIIFNPSREAEE